MNHCCTICTRSDGLPINAEESQADTSSIRGSKTTLIPFGRIVFLCNATEVRHLAILSTPVSDAGAYNHPLCLCATRLKAKAKHLPKYITDRKERADPCVPYCLNVRSSRSLLLSEAAQDFALDSSVSRLVCPTIFASTTHLSSQEHAPRENSTLPTLPSAAALLGLGKGKFGRVYIVCTKIEPNTSSPSSVSKSLRSSNPE